MPSFLTTMQLCQVKLSLFLVSLLIISQQLQNLMTKLFPTSGTMIYPNIQMHMTDSGKSSNIFLVEIAQNYVVG